VITARLAGDQELLTRLQAMPEAIRSGLGRAMLQLAQDLERSVKGDKLSGQVLQVRSGALRATIAAEVDEAALTATVGSDPAYARAQEYGFAGTVGVRAHLRRIRQAFGRPIAEKTIAVGAFSRRMNLPERSFLRSALDEMQPRIEAAARAAIAEALAT
jgi:hypothetical protein